MELPTISNFFKKGAQGAATGILDGVKGIISKFVTDPDKKLEAESTMAQLEASHIEAMAKIEIDAGRIELEERQSFLKDIADARNANVQIQSSTAASWLSKNVAYCLDIFVALVWGFLAIFIVLKLFKLAGEAVDMSILLSLFGTVTAVFMMTMSFHRGSSKGSEDKSKQINEMIAKSGN